jgi:nucleoside-diphosphate-sugar epimerase
MKKILITGGAGYIGSVLTELLLLEGYSVSVVDLFDKPESSLAYGGRFKNFRAIRMDVLDRENLIPIIEDHDVIIPLAALVGAPLCERHKTTAEMLNFQSVEFICKAVRSDQLVIYPNTNSGYGIMEGGAEFCTETSPLNPISIYGDTKVRAENSVIESNGIAFRLATVFGSSYRMRTDLMVNEFVYRALKDRVIVLFEANFRRNFIHVRDVCSAFIYAIENEGLMRSNVYNLGLSSANLTKKQLCEKIKLKIPNFAIIEHEISYDPDKRDYLVSNAKLEATGWSPKFTIDDGISELKNFYETFSPLSTSNV